MRSSPISASFFMLALLPGCSALNGDPSPEDMARQCLGLAIGPKVAPVSGLPVKALLAGYEQDHIYPVSWESGENGRYILRMELKDDLTRREQKLAYQFRLEQGTGHGKSCGPDVLAVERLSIDEVEQQSLVEQVMIGAMIGAQRLGLKPDLKAANDAITSVSEEVIEQAVNAAPQTTVADQSSPAPESAAAETKTSLQRREGSPATAGAVRSTDGRYEVWIAEERAPSVTDDGQQTLWVRDVSNGVRRRLISSHYDSARERNLTNLRKPVFSLDGGYVYLNASDAAPGSASVQQVNVQTGATRFVAGGFVLGVIRTGPYRGYLLAQQHRYRPQGGSYNPVIVIRPDGREMFTVPGSETDAGEEAVQPWLREKGWRAW